MNKVKKKKRVWKKFAVYATGFLAPMLLNGCAENLNGSFCEIYEPVYPDYERDTESTLKQIDRNNIVYLRCK
nr:MAG TPA: hypothetical protein [Caudoviricetes sp.]DAQ93840.1 MAG TPA: hypothetical protein [Caudoviricetes sp.]